MQGFLSDSERNGDGIFKGKGLSAFRESAQGYSALLAMFGGVENMPSSVMRAKKSTPDQDRDQPAAEKGYKNTAPLALSGKYKGKDRDEKLPKAIRQSLSMSGGGCAVGALSTFPQNVGRSITLLYSDPGDTVFDPFAGHNSRMDLCVNAGRHYTGCDLSTDFMAFNRRRADVLRKKHPQARITLHHCDSRKVPVKSESGDFTITSPPYWDIEYYGDEPEQLGKSQTYKEFLGGLGRVMKENFRVLKSGAYAAWFINDFRKDGKMHFYHADVIRLGKKAGFVAHDIVVVDLGRGYGDCFPNRMMEMRIIPKRHEYGVIFRKP